MFLLSTDFFIVTAGLRPIKDFWSILETNPSIGAQAFSIFMNFVEL
jgi:hypothetical protein